MTDEIPEQLKRLNIIPVKPDSKEPAIKWKEYQRKKYDMKVPPNFNYGIICGEVSDNLVVVDFDDRKLYERFFSDIETFTVETPNGGVHLYFYSEKPVRKILKFKGYPIDVQGEGSIVVVPPSKINGGEYRILRNAEIKRMNVIELLEKRLPKLSKRDETIERIKREIDISEYIERYIERKYEGKGYWQGLCPFHPDTKPSFTVYGDHFYCFGCGKHGDVITFVQEYHGLDFKEAVRLLCEEYGIKWFERKYHVRDYVSSLSKKGDLQRNVGSVRDVRVSPNFKLSWGQHDVSKNKVIEKIDILDINDHSQEMPFTDEQSGENPDMDIILRDIFFDESNKFIAKRLADEILLENRFVTLTDTEEIWYYDSETGIWKAKGDVIIKALCQKYLGEDANRNRVAEVIAHIQRSTYVDRSIFDDNPNLIAVENGVLNLETKELLPYSPDYYLTVRIPVIYDPEADCPEIKRFLKEILHPEDIPVIEELFGYCLYRKYPIHKAFMFVGSGRNGKSTLLRVFEALLGPQNVSHVPLQAFSESRFAVAELYGKLANIYADLSPTALHDTGLFKTLTGEDSIEAERKFKNPFRFVNHAKLIYSCNKLPETYDDTDAFFSRWIIINFPNKFEGENADKKLIDKLTTPEELSGLLNLALNGLERLLKKGEFSKGASTEEVRETYLRMSDPVSAFVMDMIEIDAESFVPKKELYAVFCEYCRENNLPTVSENTFHRKLIRYVKVEDYRPKISGKRITAWRGIRIVQKEKEEMMENEDLNFWGDE